MLASKCKTVILTAMLALGAASAHAAIIDFEGVVSQDSFQSYAPGTTMSSSDGYTITANLDTSFIIGPSYYPASSTPSNGTDYAQITLNSSLTLTSSTNALFSVNSIDLANVFYYGLTSIATFTGTHADGTLVTTQFVLATSDPATTTSFTTKLLTDFTNLTSFTIGATGYAFHVDNINVSAVPEPATWAMLGLGLAMVGFATRRKKSA